MATVMNNIMLDLQKQLENAKVDLKNLSTVAQKGDSKLVEKMISENLSLSSSSSQSDSQVLQSQLYIACFWGFRDIVKTILEQAPHSHIDVNYQNRGTLWTPLHIAAFQEHGPIIMLLMSNGASAYTKDSHGRTPKDFASASDKIWGHFAAEDIERTPKADLVGMGIMKQIYAEGSGPLRSPRLPGEGIAMATSNPTDYEYSGDPYMQAAVSGDVLANDTNVQPNSNGKGPQFSIYK